jgi:hypothetical protein
VKTLLLNAGCMPVGIIDWQLAVQLVRAGDASLVSSHPTQRVRSQHVDMAMPTVVRDPMRFDPLGLTANRENVIARDRHTCLYCGAQPRRPGGRPDMESLTIDHVVPRAQSEYGYVSAPWRGGAIVSLNDWENLATACQPCNQRKADRTPREARMRLRVPPTQPGAIDAIRILFSRVGTVPAEWQEHLAF